MYPSTITLALAMLSGAAMTVGAPLGPDESSMPVSNVLAIGQFGEECEGWPLIDPTGKGRAHFQCTTVPSGVQVRGVFSNSTNTVYTSWFSDTAVHETADVNPAAGYTTSVESQRGSAPPDDNNDNPPDRDDEDTSSGDCVATRHEYDVSWGRNKFSVSLRCTRIRAGIKVRGVLDLVAQDDGHTSWVTGPIQAPIEIESGRKQPSTLTDPSVRVEYKLV